MQLKQGGYVRQAQTLRLSPQMLQSVKLMELPAVELREKIIEELEKNPALEVRKKERAEVSLDELGGQTGEERSWFETSSDAGFVSSGRNALASDEHQQFIEGALTRSETLQEHLLFQLRLQPCQAEVRRLGELFIQNLESDGFHIEDIHLLAKGAEAADIQAALDLVRGLDPQGCCTADFKESLAVQAALAYGDAAEGIIALIPHMQELERGKTVKLRLKNADVPALFAKLKTLSPFPGRQFASDANSSQTRYVIPDVRVVRSEGCLKIVMNYEAIPVLGLTRFFVEHGNAPKADERNYIREALGNAQGFIDALNRRKRTIFRVCRAIVCLQRDFFEYGPQRLVPLTLADIARKLGVHETTVSRAANGKYMETEWGIFEIRRFFTNSITGAGSQGSRFSQEGVKETIRSIIQAENRPLTDSDIVRMLSERGIPLARRTVAKYRSQLDLGSSYSR